MNAPLLFESGRWMLLSDFSCRSYSFEALRKDWSIQLHLVGSPVWKIARFFMLWLVRTFLSELRPFPFFQAVSLSLSDLAPTLSLQAVSPSQDAFPSLLTTIHPKMLSKELANNNYGSSYCEYWGWVPLFLEFRNDPFLSLIQCKLYSFIGRAINRPAVSEPEL